MKKTIALLTDFGLVDNYVGIMKGVILKINPNVHLVDINHTIDSQDIEEGALTLKNSYLFFPKNTVFVAVVDPGVGSKRNAIVAKAGDYYFVAPDNGILAPIIEQNPSSIIHTITNNEYFLKPVSKTFHGRDVFAPVAAYLSKGEAIRKFGPVQADYVRWSLPEPVFDQKNKRVVGEVTEIDHFGNLITNIESRHLKALKNRYAVRVRRRTIRHVNNSYAGVKKGAYLAMIGSKGFLEISINQGSAKTKLGAKKGDRVQVVGK